MVITRDSDYKSVSVSERHVPETPVRFRARPLILLFLFLFIQLLQQTKYVRICMYTEERVHVSDQVFSAAGTASLTYIYV
jgi:hypothetical protein